MVVGARSALFLPFADLGLIVVDEEHEGAYKQEDGVVYNARDMAVVRARFEAAPSCSPPPRPRSRRASTPRRAATRWLRAARPVRRGDPSRLTTVDLRRDGPPRGRWLSPPPIAGIAARSARGEQALLFLNRRGYAPLTLCRACGHRFECPNCAAWLVEHRFRAALVCHHCGHVEPKPDLCTQCGEAESLTACGPGVERLAEEATPLFPDARLLTCRRTFPAASTRCGGARRGGARRFRHHHRHAARRQGPQFPAPDLRRRGRRRRRPLQRRPARRRADVSAAAPGDRAGGARRTRGAAP